MKNWQKILLVIFAIYVLQLALKTSIDMWIHYDAWVNPSFAN